jgi:MFS family permease
LRADRLAVLRLRDFRLLLAGQAVSVLGDRAFVVALPFAVLSIGGSPSAVGLVLACGTVPLLGSVLVGGVVADRVSRRSVMVAADIARVVAQGAMAALLIGGVAEVWMLAALAGVAGAATGFFSPASTGLLPEVVAADQLQPANALRATVMSAGEIGGPLVGGLVTALASPGWAIAADAGTFAASAVLLSLLRVPERPARELSGFVADLKHGWTAVRSRRWVWAPLVYFGFANVMWAAWSALGPVVADRDLGGADAWGTVLSAMGFGALAGSILAVRVRPSRPLVIVAFADAMLTLPLAFLAAGWSVPVLAVAAFLMGGGMMLGNSVWEATLQQHIPGESLSRVASYDWFMSLAFFPIGLLLWAPLASVVGIHTALWISFGLFAAAVAVLLTLPDIWRLPARPDHEHA